MTKTFWRLAALLMGIVASTFTSSASAFTTYHVREHGGTSAQCTGLVNADYSGTGLAQPCAWSSPTVALPTGGVARFAGGDTLFIHSGTYMIGYGAPETIGFGCHISFTYDCIMAPIPSGPSAANRTKIVGDGYTGACNSPSAKLWGTGRLFTVLNMRASSHVEVSCLDISDHEDCVTAFDVHPKHCNRDNFANLLSADTGILAVDSVDVKLTSLNVHGLASTGIQAGRLADWYMNKVRLAANGSSGWNGDTSGIGPCIDDDSHVCSINTGVIEFKNSLIEWNGCAESADLVVSGCFGQPAGGYGDGLGTSYTAGAWNFVDTSFVNNTSDGLDMLYASLPGATVTVNRVLAAHNSGNQLKIAGSGSVKNSVIFADCGFFAGKSFTFDTDHCRAGGDALAFSFVRAADRVLMYNNTVVSQGGSIVLVTGQDASTSGASLKMRNNIFVGQPYYWDASLRSREVSNVSQSWVTVDDDFNIKETISSARNCVGNSNLCSDLIGYAGLVAVTLANLNPHTTSASPARNSGLTQTADPAVPGKDYQNISRGVGAGGYFDRGAIEE